MGCFDRVKDQLYCPFCGALQPEGSFQTKSFSCLMDTKTVEDFLDEKPSFEMHTMCNACNHWISLNVCDID